MKTMVLIYLDLVTTEHLAILKSAIQKLNPAARIIASTFSKVPPEVILNTGLFDFEEAEQSAGWIEELQKDEHTPETEEYGISSFVFRSKKPFDPDRFWQFVQQKFPTSIIRSKGLFWLASRPEQALVWGQAGGSLKADSAGVWWSSMSFQKRMQFPSFLDNQDIIEENWHKEFGDRKNEIVFIGQDIEKELILAELNTCLATDTEIASQMWRVGYDDEWPVQKAYAM